MNSGAFYLCTTPPALVDFILFFLWYWGLNPGAFYLRAIPPALFFLYFILKPGLMKWRRASLGRERERQGERQGERERETGRERERYIAHAHGR